MFKKHCKLHGGLTAYKRFMLKEHKRGALLQQKHTHRHTHNVLTVTFCTLSTASINADIAKIDLTKDTD